MTGGRLRALPEPRGRAAGGSPAPVPERAVERSSPDRDATALRAYRAEAIGLLADDEARRAGRKCMTARERRLARQRRDRWATSLVATVEGRELVRQEAEIIAGARPAARAMARSVDAYKAVLASAIDLFVSSVLEYGLRSPTARSFALQHAILAEAATALLAEAFEGGSSVMTSSRSAKDGNGVSGSVQLAGFRDLATIAAAFVTKSQIAIESSWRAEDRARLEAKEQARMQTQREATARIAAERMAREQEPEHGELEAEQDDAEGRGFDLLPPSAGEHGARAEVASFSSARADDLDSDDDQEQEQEPELTVPALEAGAFCPLRGKLVPASLAGKAPPGAASGPTWPQRLRDEQDAIARWEKANELAMQRALNAKARKR
jgi:hypothetical protein